MVFQQIRNKLKFLPSRKHLIVIALPFLCYPLIDEFFRYIYTIIVEKYFPIYKMDARIPFSYITGSLLSIVWYAILVALFINIPLAKFLQCFKEKQRYKYYKFFWWISLFIFAVLSVLAYPYSYAGYGSNDYSATLIFVSTLFCVSYLTLILGAYLYSKQTRPSDNHTSRLFSTLEYRCGIAIIAIALFTVSPLELLNSISRAIVAAAFSHL